MSDVRISHGSCRAPCKNCNKRAEGCHSKCARYKLFKCANQVSINKYYDFRKEDDEYLEYCSEKKRRLFT